MKTLLLALLCFTSVPAFAQQFNNLTEDDVKDVSREFGVNFSHTAVAAPETDGLWGVEVGLLAGQTASPELKEVITDSGGDGKDFKNIYHAGLMARAHIPFDLFAELSVLPEREISDVTVSNKTFGLGWNAGAFFGLPVDLAVGVNRANSKISFDQTVPAPTTIDLESKTTSVWLGVSKTFLFVTPYLKYGRMSVDSDLMATTDIFVFTNEQKESAKESGNFLTAGVNLQLFLFKLGFEGTSALGVKRYTGKLSIDF